MTRVLLSSLIGEQDTVSGVRVAAYMRNIHTWADIEPVTVAICPFSNRHHLWDGFHRSVAHILSGQEDILATVGICEHQSVSCWGRDVCAGEKPKPFWKDMAICADEGDE